MRDSVPMKNTDDFVCKGFKYEGVMLSSKGIALACLMNSEVSGLLPDLMSLSFKKKILK